ncbi:MAG: metallophosphoesterase [Verrucomicrobiota bacterium]
MKLLVVSDLHFALPQMDWLMSNAERYDAVIIAGDLLDIAGRIPIGNQIVIVLKYLERISERRPLLVCSGNHDGDSVTMHNEYVASWLEQANNVQTFVDGESTRLGDMLVTILPWWDGPETRREMDEFLEKEGKKESPLWLWLHHAPPQGSPISWTGKKDAGDPNLNRLIARYRPDFVFCGHIHNSPFRSGGSWHDKVDGCWVFNSGKQIGEIPAHISIDFDKKEATWVSLAGVESVSLA